LGPTYDYIHRLLDFKLAAEGNIPVPPEAEVNQDSIPRAIDTLDANNRQVAIELLEERKQKGCAAIGIFHDREVRSSLGTRELLF